jgi:thioredoxin reductase (NADPH)
MAEYDVVIVGGGPAGLTAGIYCLRRGLKAAVVERGSLGGQMLSAHDVENWPGDRKVSGRDLARRMADHAKSLGVEFIYDEAIGFNHSGSPKEVHLRQRTLACSAIILATGGVHKTLKLEGEEEFAGRGVSYCATCDGPFFRAKTVAVVGGGNMAVEDSLYLSEITAKTYLVGKEVSAEAPLTERLGRSKVERVTDAVEAISGTDKVQSVRLSSGRRLSVDGVFIAAGHSASSELASSAGVQLDGRGFIRVGRGMETNFDGVYAAGDVTGGIPQIATAAGEGCTAALKAYAYVKNR